jgi:hypothetical protein
MGRNMTIQKSIATRPGEPTQYRPLTAQEQAAYDAKVLNWESIKLSAIKEKQKKQIKVELASRIYKAENISLQKQINCLIDIVESLRLENKRRYDYRAGTTTNTDIITPSNNQNSDFDGVLAHKVIVNDIIEKSESIASSLDSMDYDTLVNLDVTDQNLWV